MHSKYGTKSSTASCLLTKCRSRETLLLPSPSSRVSIIARLRIRPLLISQSRLGNSHRCFRSVAHKCWIATPLKAAYPPMKNFCRDSWRWRNMSAVDIHSAASIVYIYVCYCTFAAPPKTQKSRSRVVITKNIAFSNNMYICILFNFLDCP